MNFKNLPLIAIFCFISIDGHLHADSSRDKKPQQDVQQARPTPQPQQPRKQPSSVPKPQVDKQKPPSRDQKAADFKRAEKSDKQNPTIRSPSLSPQALKRNQERSKNNKTPENTGFKQQMQKMKDTPRSATESPEKTKREQQVRTNFKQRVKEDRKASNNVSTRIKKNHPHYNHWFNNNFFKQHHYHPPYWQNSVNWWQGTRWPQLHVWLGWAPASYPVYYSYGDAIQINQPLEEQQTASLPETSSSWLPLGVYAVGADENQAANANIFIQLAINQQGDIAGTYYNAATNQNYAIEGMVDKNTQQVYWRQANDISAPVMTTGLYNLTQDVADVQLTFPTGTIQYWSLVRIEDPS